MHEPKLYQRTGRPIDPDYPALDSALIQYEDVIPRALKETADAGRVHNLTKQQRSTFYEVKESIIDGSSDVIPLMADLCYYHTRTVQSVTKMSFRHRSIHRSRSAYHTMGRDQERISETGQASIAVRTHHSRDLQIPY